MPILTKRWNDPVDEGDGYRVLICRYRPRGVKKEEEPWDVWCDALAPSKELHADVYGKGGAPPIAWEEYVRRFRREMESRGVWIEAFARRVRSGETLTFLCSSACVDPAHCHRTIVAELVAKAAAPPKEEHRPTVVRRHRSS